MVSLNDRSVLWILPISQRKLLVVFMQSNNLKMHWYHISVLHIPMQPWFSHNLLFGELQVKSRNLIWPFYLLPPYCDKGLSGISPRLKIMSAKLSTPSMSWAIHLFTVTHNFFRFVWTETELAFTEVTIAGNIFLFWAFPYMQELQYYQWESFRHLRMWSLRSRCQNILIAF